MRAIARARGAAFALTALTLTAAATANAQGLPLDRFDPAPAGDRMFDVPSPTVSGHLVPAAAVLFDYAHNPLVFRDTTAAGSVVGSQLFMHVNASLALWNRVSLNLEMPFALAQGGTSPKVGAMSYASPDKPQIGDLRTGLRVRVFGENDGIFQVGLGGFLWLPTGPADGYVGTGSARGMAQLLLGGQSDRIVWSFSAGSKIQGTQSFAGVTQGTEVNVGAGVGVRLLRDRSLQIGPEAYGAFTVAHSDKSMNDALKRASNVEVLADARYRVIDEIEIGLGAGPGLTTGIGTPDFRGIVMAAYRPSFKAPPPPPARPAPPPPPVEHVVAAAPPPPPVVVAAPPPPPPVVEKRDPCADIPGGCPIARVTEKEIVIGEQVQFEPNSDRIKPESKGLLDNIAAVLKEHPELLKVEVQGHTDNRGSAAVNRTLSRQRAFAVLNALVRRSIDRNRLTVKAVGPDMPIADNATDEGRMKNRRVELKILDRKH